MLLGMLLGLLLVMLFWPETAMGRWLHQQLVERPVDAASALTRQQIIFAVAVLLLVFCAGETIAMMGSADLVLALAGDVSLYLDVVIATYTLSTMGRMRSAVRAFRGTLSSRQMRRSRTSRSASRAKASRRALPKQGDNDEDPAALFLLAA